MVPSNVNYFVFQALQDALVTCKWDVCETRAYLLENPPRRMAPNPYRNAQFNIFPSSGSRDVDSDSEEEEEVTPQVCPPSSSGEQVSFGGHPRQ